MPVETQQSIGDWINTTFPGTDPDSPRKSLRALEEMVELCLASGATPGQITEATKRGIHGGSGPFLRINECDPRPENIPVEAADVLIVLYGVANMRGFDIHEYVDSKMKTNRARTWHALGDGTGYHVKAKGV